MTFTTFTFAIFLLVVFTLYWTFRNRRIQNALVLGASYFFYGWWDWRYCGLMLTSSLIDYCAGLGLEKHKNPRVRKAILATAMTANLSMLGIFKYYNFFVNSAIDLLGALGLHYSPQVIAIVLPVGISFYTFQTMCYSIDVYRGKLAATHSMVDFLAYVSFFPQLVAGPIERAGNLLPQFLNDRVFDPAKARDGCRQMLWGAFKKMVVADNLGVFSDQVFHAPATMPGPVLFLGVFFFTIQIYCDFSGYSDMAVGMARLFGFTLMRNFAYPFFSQSIDEFWRRWHISLSTWFLDYLYVPLGGSREGLAKHYRNIMVTFLLSGLWHGAAWTYLVWGAMHGAAIVVVGMIRRRGPKLTVSHVPGGESLLPSAKTAAKIAATFLFIVCTFVVFRCPTIAATLDFFARMFTDFHYPRGFIHDNVPTKIPVRGLIALCAILLGLEWIQRRHDHPLAMPGLPVALRWTVYSVLVWTILVLGTYASGQFIYFQF